MSTRAPARQTHAEPAPAPDRRGARPDAHAPAPMEALQRQLGNRAFRRAASGALPRVQRCACGGTCPHCKAKEEAAAIQAKLTVGPPGDAYEREADAVAERVMRMPAPGAEGVAGAASGIQRLAGGGAAGGSTDLALPRGEARPLSAGTRAFMEPRFGADFSGVRLHAGPRAQAAADRLQARAFASGPDIWLGRGAAEGDRRLMAHELTHVVQQGAAGGGGAPAAARVQRRWDAAGSDCAGQPTDRWIERVVVRQETPQTVTLHWSDGATESGPCSSGKGHCCVDPAAPDGVACTAEGSKADGSNCTPITARRGYPIANRVRDHDGVAFWSEFVPDRAIALHEYRPVDGTPLSHGCVRMNHDLAVRLWCGARQNQTWVQVLGFARPMCNHPGLQTEWANDFAWGGSDLSAYDGDRTSQNAIREARRMINASFGRTLTPAEIRALGPADIPRCTQSVARPPPPTPAQP